MVLPKGAQCRPKMPASALPEVYPSDLESEVMVSPLCSRLFSISFSEHPTESHVPPKALIIIGNIKPKTVIERGLLPFFSPEANRRGHGHVLCSFV